MDIRVQTRHPLSARAPHAPHPAYPAKGLPELGNYESSHPLPLTSKAPSHPRANRYTDINKTKWLPTATCPSSPEHTDHSPEWSFQEPASSPAASCHRRPPHTSTADAVSAQGHNRGPAPTACQPDWSVPVPRRLPVTFTSLIFK